MESPVESRVVVRALFIIASVVVILIGVRLAAPIINPILLALVITILCNPIFTWMQQRGVPTWAALLGIAGGFIVFAALFSTFIGVSISRLTARLGDYQLLLVEQENRLRTLAIAYGFDPANLQYFGIRNIISLPTVLGPLLTGLGNILGNSLLVSVLVLFFLVEMPFFRQRLSGALGEHSPLFRRLSTFGGSVVRFFAIRTYINLVVASGSTIALLLLQVDFALLWGLLIFLLSYIPYIGIPIALIPPSLLTFAESGLVTALLVITAVTLVNMAMENLIAPSLLGRSLNISPTVVFLSFFFWTWLLGPPGTFLSMPITVLIMFTLDSFDETRWLAQLMGAPADLTENERNLPELPRPSTLPQQEPPG